MNNVHGFESISTDLENDFNLYIKLFILLYADDTILFSESKEDLQVQLNIFHEYCSTVRVCLCVRSCQDGRCWNFWRREIDKNLLM